MPSANEDPGRTAYLLDRLDIYDCTVRYARGVDRHDADLIASAFWPDAQVNYGTFSGPRDEFVTWAIEFTSRFACHAHHITGQPSTWMATSRT
jgi:hypothetical protein